MTVGLRPVHVVGAAAVSAFGFDWRGLGAALATDALVPASSVQLAATHGEVAAFEVPPIPEAIDVEARSRKLMSHPARLAAIALRAALQDADWLNRAWIPEETGLFLGVGASGCSMRELSAMLDACIADQKFSLADFGTAGLAACNPLFAFQLMNNFTLCHGAISQGVGGPNAAFYSRGNGTAGALSEAAWLIASGECERALAGGADSALHPVTWAQLNRGGFVDEGLVPGDGAALLALSSGAEGALAILEHCEFHDRAALRDDPVRVVDAMLARSGLVAGDIVLLAPWGDSARELLQRVPADLLVVDISRGLGDALASTPALAWVAALDLLLSEKRQRAVILHAGIDGGVGMVVLRSVA